MQQERVRIGTHHGTFHADDPFATTTLLREYPDAEIIRTRDEALLATCNFRLDVGGKYDPETGDYDHHQSGGAGQRPNGIRYSAFGLVWMDYGPQISGSQEAADLVDLRLVQGIDADDNGQRLARPTGEFRDARPLDIAEAIKSFNPCWDEDESGRHSAFMEAVTFAGRILDRVIRKAQSDLRAKKEGWVEQAIAQSYAHDPRIIILARGLSWHNIVTKHAPRALFVVLPNPEGGWNVQAIPQNPGDRSRGYRKLLPASWSAKGGMQSAAARTGVQEATFVHNNRHFCVASSYEAAYQLAWLAVEA